MTQAEKLLSRLRSKPTPRDFTWDDLCTVLKRHGFEQVKTGKTGGSARRFVHSTGITFTAHEPHPHNVLKTYQIQAALSVLEEIGVITNE